MAITVNFRISSGIVNTRQFQKNVGVSVFGKLTGMAGVGEPGTHIRMEILDRNGNSIFFDETNANLWGDYNFWFRTPNKDARYEIVLIATYSISGQDNVTIPIAVGNVHASSAPSPEAEGLFFEIIPVILISAGLIYAIKIINE